MAGGLLNATDWSTNGNWSSGTKPAIGDEAIIPNTNAANITIAGDETAVDLDMLYVQRGYTNTFGTSASPLQFSADLIKVLGSSGFYFEGTDVTTDEIRLQMPNNNTPVELGNADTGDFERVICNRGLITLKANILFSATGIVEVGWKNDRANDVRVIIASGADTLPNLRMNGGTVTSDGAITEAHIRAGTLTQDTAAVTTAYVYDGARLELNGNGTVATTVVVYGGGTLDLLQTSFLKTITTLYLFPGANIVWDKRTYDAGGVNTEGLHVITNAPFDMRDAE